MARRFLLSKGSTKLGESIFGWALEAGATCPGKTPTCSHWCYASHGRFCTEQMKARNAWRLGQAKKAGFVDRVCDEIFRRGVLILRVHVGGDFFSPKYTQKWIEIAARNPNVKMFAYSRSWRVEKVRPLLYAWGALPNVRLWLSADRDAYPKNVPQGVRVAYMQVAEEDAPRGDLTFQVRRLRKLSLPTAPPICGQETVQGKRQGVNCSNCSVCWQ